MKAAKTATKDRKARPVGGMEPASCLPIFKCPGRHGDHPKHRSLSPCSWHLLGSIVYSIKRTFSSVELPRVLIANEAVAGTQSAVVLRRE